MKKSLIILISFLLTIIIISCISISYYSSLPDEYISEYVFLDEDSFNNLYLNKSQHKDKDSLLKYTDYYINFLAKHLDIKDLDWLKKDKINIFFIENLADKENNNIYINSTEFVKNYREYEYKIFSYLIESKEVYDKSIHDLLFLNIFNKFTCDINNDNFSNYIFEYAASKYLKDGDPLNVIENIGNFDVNADYGKEATYFYLNYSFIGYLLDHYEIDKICLLSKSTDKNSYYDIFGKSIEELRTEWVSFQDNNFLKKEMFFCTDDIEDIFTEDEGLELMNYDKYFNQISKEKKDFISNSEAIEDIEALFKIIKSRYGLYDFFGREEVFNAAEKEAIISVTDKEYLSIDEFNQLLLESLNFVEDKHFYLGEYIYPQKSCYYNENLIISKEGTNYFINLDSKKQKILRINEDINLSHYIKPTINSSGAEGFALYIDDVPDKRDIYIELELESNNYIKNTLVPLKEDKHTINVSDKIYEYKEIANIPILTLYSMNYIPFNSSSIDWIKSAEKMKDKSSFIIDLRSNSGGRSEYGDYWIEEFTGQLPARENQSYKIGIFEKLSAETQILQPLLSTYSEHSFYYPFLYTSIDEMIMNNKSFVYYKKNDEKNIIKNDKKIYVLFNRQTGSAAEWFIDALKDIENVTFVGTNSAGCMISANAGSLFLPNSDLQFVCGFGSYIADKNNFSEDYGFEPDIWINSSDSLNRAIELIKKETEDRP